MAPGMNFSFFPGGGGRANTVRVPTVSEAKNLGQLKMVGLTMVGFKCNHILKNITHK